MKKINLIIPMSISFLLSGCGAINAMQKGISPDYYHNVNKDIKNHTTYISSDELIFIEIDEKRLANPAELALGIGPRRINLNPGIHTLNVYTGLSTLTFSKIEIRENHNYYFNYISKETFWLEDLTDKKVIYGYKPNDY